MLISNIDLTTGKANNVHGLETMTYASLSWVETILLESEIVLK
jgi:hypothetical protein